MGLSAQELALALEEAEKNILVAGEIKGLRYALEHFTPDPVAFKDAVDARFEELTGSSLGGARKTSQK